MIGYDTQGRLLFVVQVEVEGESIRIISARKAPHRSTTFMIPEKLKARLTKDRPMTTITLRVPVDVVESLKAIAPLKGLRGYQALLKAYVSEGLRRDEAMQQFGAAARLAEALRKRGVPAEVIAAAAQDAAA